MATLDLNDSSFARDPFSPSSFASLADFGQKGMKGEQHLECVSVFQVLMQVGDGCAGM